MRLYFILLICIRACVNAENDEPTIISSEAEELLNFLVEIHEEFCGNSTRCRDNLNHTKQPDGVMFPEACCLPCSCSHTCRSRRNCCPEYLIQDYNQSTVLEHISSMYAVKVLKIRTPKIIYVIARKLNSLMLYINWSKQVKPNVNYIHRRLVNISRLNRSYLKGMKWL